MRPLVLLLVGLHAVVLFAHDVAHRGLGVDLRPWQAAFAYGVIVAAPIVAALLLFARRPWLGYGLLAVAMLASFVFGVYHHYLLISPDHVQHLPEGDEQSLFRWTAAAMAVLELAGAALGAAGWRGSRRGAP